MSGRRSLSPGSHGCLADVQEMAFEQQPLERAKRTSLAQIAIPSFSDFRDRASSIPISISSPVKRKPLPKNASPRILYSPRAQGAPSAFAPYDATAGAHWPSSAESLGSPLPQLPTGLASVVTPPLTTSSDRPVSHQNQALDAHLHSYESTAVVAHARAISLDTRLAGTEVDIKRRSVAPAAIRPSSIPVPLRYGDKDAAHHEHVAKPRKSSVSSFAPTSNPASSPASHRRSHSSIMSAQAAPILPIQPTQPPAMTVQLEGIDRVPRSFTSESFGSSGTTSPTQRRSKSPGEKFSSFFGWKSSPHPGDSHSPTTTFSEHSASPLPSPSLQKLDHFDRRRSSMGLTPPALDTHRASNSQPDYFDVSGAPLLSGSASINAHVEELERELRQVSSELAGSIRREMELEDEIERLQADVSSFQQEHPHEQNRRGSDYFSDSGTSSLRFPLGDSDAKIEELEKLRRKVEQEKAQLQVDYAEKLALELGHRKELEIQLHALEDEIQTRQESALQEPDTDERVRELETHLDDARRRLSQERQAKENFEDMFAALREESTKHCNERDNLRDEVLPQLRARIEGLEAEAAVMQSQQYEHARLQQEITTLRQDNLLLQEAQNNQPQDNPSGSIPEDEYAKIQQELTMLRNENKLLQEAQDNPSKFRSIAEDDTVVPNRWPRAGLSRSNSLARSSSHGNLKRGSSLTRSGSVKERTSTSGEPRSRSDSVSNERVKDVEEQRDALHKALKNLLRRFENQKREHSKAMRRLMADRDRARSVTPARLGYSREVHFLREEIGILRRRADEALEQKWQAENNISGVKMALDRAGQETKSLRDYLAGRQSGLIRSPPRRSVMGGLGISMPSEEPELGEEERHAMIKVLRQSIQLAEHERDAALREAEAYRARALTLQNSGDDTVETERELASELLAAASRMEELAAQVQSHLQSNMQLRQRLTDAVQKGEKQQSESTARITDMQSRLKQMEDNVMFAQQQSEAAMGAHEEEAKKLDEANSPSLSRLSAPFTAATQRGSPVVKSPLMSQGIFAKSPKIGQAGNGPSETLFEATKTSVLERRVRELEAALAEADGEMKEVVERINNSQYEIAELQGERDNAQKLMRRLQKDIADERLKTEQLMTPV